MLVIGLGENAMSIDEPAQRKNCLHANGTGVAANDNVTCRLRKEPTCTLDALGKIKNACNQKLTSHNMLPDLKLAKFIKRVQEKYISFDFSPF